MCSATDVTGGTLAPPETSGSNAGATGAETPAAAAAHANIVIVRRTCIKDLLRSGLSVIRERQPVSLVRGTDGRRAVSFMPRTVATAAHMSLTCHNTSLTPEHDPPRKGMQDKRSHAVVSPMPNSRADKTFVPLSADRGVQPRGLPANRAVPTIGHLRLTDRTRLPFVADLPSPRGFCIGARQIEGEVPGAPSASSP